MSSPSDITANPRLEKIGPAPEAITAELARFENTFNELPDLLIAYSGGLDSTVLLYLITQAFGYRCRVRAAHVHHGLQQAADQWVAHCQQTCEVLGIDLAVCKVEIDRQDPAGLEAACRHARYQAFQSILEPGEVLLTAHHRDDQVETFFLNLFRGSGLRGLRGMQAERRIGQNRLMRPLLRVSRQQLSEWADANQLVWVEDPSNQQVKHRRNWLRQELLPQVRQQIPGLDQVVAATSENCMADWQLLESVTSRDLEQVQTDRPYRLCVGKLLSLDRNRRNRVWMSWFRQLGLPAPNRTHLDQIDSICRLERPDATPLVDWPGCEVRRYKSNLYAMATIQFPPKDTVIHWASLKIDLPGDAGTLCWESAGDEFQPPELILRFAVTGATIKPAGDRHNRRLKLLFQQREVPVWERLVVPYIYIKDELSAVGDYWQTDQLLELQQRYRTRLIYKAGIRYQSALPTLITD